MNNNTIYVWESGYWIWSTTYDLCTTKPVGAYKEFVIGEGFQQHEVQELVDQYLFDLWNDEDDD